MNFLNKFLDIILHIGPHIESITASYGAWVYLLLSAIVFCESGIVITPFLPGDSMLFVIGTLAAAGKLNIHIAVPSLISGAILGYWFNYWVGTKFASKVLRHEDIRFINRTYIERTQSFYQKYGPKALVLARFMPITRTFAPFLAGVARMNKTHFFCFNVISAFLWIPTIIYIGYFFGNIPVVRDNFTFVIVGIIVISVLPAVVEILKHKLGKAQTDETK